MRHPLTITAAFIGLSLLQTHAHAEGTTGSWRLFVTDHSDAQDHGA